MNQQLLNQLMPHPYDMATEKQLSMLNALSYATELKQDISWLTFGSRPKMTKQEASDLIGLLQAKNQKQAATLASLLKARDNFIFHLENFLKGGE